MGAGRGQFGAHQVALGSECVHLRGQQFVGALQLLMPEQQPVDVAGKLEDYGGLIGHGPRIVGLCGSPPR